MPVVLITLLIFISSPSLANSVHELTLKLMPLARENLHQAKISDGSFVPVETIEEKKTPIVSVTDAERAVERGMLTGMAAWCNLNWQSMSYMPYMQYERAKKIWTDKQLAYIGLLHGISQGIAESSSKQNGECSTEQSDIVMRNIVDNNIKLGIK